MKVSFTLTFFTICLVALATADCPHKRSGLTRPGSLNVGSSFTVAKGKSVILDKTTPVLKSIVVQDGGTLIIADGSADGTDLSINVEFIRVEGGGTLLAGQYDCPLDKKVILTFFGPKTTSSPIGSVGQSTLGAKGLVCMKGSVCEMHGRRKLSWTSLSSIAQKGSKVLSLKDAPSGWRAGDAIVVTSTDFMYTYWHKFDNNEMHTIAGVDMKNKRITLEKELEFMHWVDENIAGEVGMLTQSIVIQGDDSTVDEKSNAYQFGGHIMFHQGPKMVKFSGVELTKMGQAGHMARYPLHWHHGDNIDPANHWIKNCSVHHTFQRCMTIHATSGVELSNNVGFLSKGHCYFLEDGAEQNNILTNNLGVGPIRVPNGDPNQLIASDDTPAVFWITNPNNTFRNNHAVGGFFGFWFSLPIQPTGTSYKSGKWRNSTTMRPRYMPLKEFTNNVAHSMSTGLMVDHMVNQDHTVDSEQYTPRLPPYDGDEPGNGERVEADFKGTVAHKCVDRAIWLRGHTLKISDSLVMDSRKGIFIANGPSLTVNSRVVGESLNVGNPVNPVDSCSRTYSASKTHHIMGYEFYDAGGPFFVRNVEFTNFKHSDRRHASAFATFTNPPHAFNPYAMIEGILLTNANAFWNPTPEGDIKKGNIEMAIADKDGTTTGTPGAWVVSATTGWLREGLRSCKRQTEWNMYLCEPQGGSVAQLSIENLNLAGTNFNGAISNTPGTVKLTFKRVSSSNTVFNDIVDDDDDDFSRYSARLTTDSTYTLEFPKSHPTPPELSFRLHFADPNEHIVLAIPYPKTTFEVSHSVYKTLKEVTRTSYLAPNTYYYSEDQEALYVVIANTMHMAPHTFNENRFHSYGESLVVKAGCGMKCSTTKRITSRRYPSTKYAGEFQACQAPGGPKTSAVVGTVLMRRFYPLYTPLSYTIFHSLPSDSVQSVQLINAAGDVIHTADKMRSPVIGVLPHLNHKEFVELYKGTLSFRIKAAGKTYQARIGCQYSGGCGRPPRVRALDQCKVNYPDLNIYSGKQSEGWKLYVDSKMIRQDAASPCGGTSIGFAKPATRSYWYIGFYTSPREIDPLRQRFVQFNIRIKSGQRLYPLNPLVLRLKNTANVYFLEVKINASHMDTLSLGPEWTRVVVDLKKEGLTSKFFLRDVIVVSSDLYRYPHDETKIEIEMDRFHISRGDARWPSEWTEDPTDEHIAKQECPAADPIPEQDWTLDADLWKEGTRYTEEDLMMIARSDEH